MDISNTIAVSRTGTAGLGQIAETTWFNTLWLAFTTTLGRSLSFLATRQLLVAVFGALLLAINHAAGAGFGAVELDYSLMGSFMILSLVWAILLPSLYLLFDQVHERREKQ